ncbi:ribonuclease H-like YkuK family protein, partial [Caldisalinibacter kiritimatiensis]|uniref:ribonuclease H-like YkuK family protein n=1 Tax=Caldisalinibacter kiritimatiensis TaxID=1304284 RepID=UPI00055284AD
FFNNHQKNLNFNDVTNEIINFVSKYPNSRYKLAIGSDSQVKVGYTVYISAIIIHRIGKGAKGFVTKKIVPREINNLREKIFIEASMTHKIASMFTLDFFEDVMDIIIPNIKKGADFKYEIHVDIGNNGETRKYIKEVAGYFAGLGFETKIKPEAYAASSYANKYTK